MKRRAVSAGILSLGFAVAGCAYPGRQPSVPRARYERAKPLGLANARYFVDVDATALMAEAALAAERGRSADQQSSGDGAISFLAISGGRYNGAFAVGLLDGWSRVGTRPVFKVVTGVSTGALMAPFAFLGSDYDALLRDLYTTMTADRIFRQRPLTAALYDDGMADTTPLAELIGRYADWPLLERIAGEYAKGRLLLISTTDLDAQRPVIWNIGAIAASGHPGSLDLFRKILRASSAIPGAFQPVLLDVELDGQNYQEMHVDGGAMAQLFVYPPSLGLLAANRKRRFRAYIIRNGRLGPAYAETERRTISIAQRAILTMVASGGSNDVVRAYFVAKRDGVDFNLAFIGEDFELSVKMGEFNPAYMRALYAYGLDKALANDVWHKSPPGLAGSGLAR